MSFLAVSLIKQFRFQAWKNCICSLNEEETKKLLLIAVKQAIVSDRPSEKIKLQDLENYIQSLTKEKAQDILLRVLRSNIAEIGLM